MLRRNEANLFEAEEHEEGRASPLSSTEPEGPRVMANKIQQRMEAKRRAQQKAQERLEKSQGQGDGRVKKVKKPATYKLDEPYFMRGKWCTYSPYRKANWHHHQGLYSLGLLLETATPLTDPRQYINSTLGFSNLKI